MVELRGWQSLKQPKEFVLKYRSLIAVGLVSLAVSWLAQAYVPAETALWQPTGPVPTPEAGAHTDRRLFDGTRVQFPHDSSSTKYIELSEEQKDFLAGMLNRGLMLLHHARVAPQNQVRLIRVMVTTVEEPVENWTYATATSYLSSSPTYCVIRISGGVMHGAFYETAGGPIPPPDNERHSLGLDWMGAHELHHCPDEEGHADYQGARFEGEQNVQKALGIYDLNNVIMPLWWPAGKPTPAPPPTPTPTPPPGSTPTAVPTRYPQYP